MSAALIGALAPYAIEGAVRLIEGYAMREAAADDAARAEWLAGILAGVEASHQTMLAVTLTSEPDAGAVIPAEIGG